MIYTIAPSYLDEQTIWVGTDDGLIQVTRDGGKTWSDVTPPELTPWTKVSLMDASHFDANTAYAAINTIRLDDLRPHIYRTRDGGKTWTHITTGMPDGGIINVVREDPKRRGLLFAGSEQAVYVSFDDGDHWQSLRNNMPATSIRDLVIKDDDLVVGTHGRSFWILDDITPLRQMARGAIVGGRASVRAAGGDSLALEQEHRHAAAARRAGGAEPARWRGHQLLAAGRHQRRGHTRHPRCVRCRSAFATRASDPADAPVEGRNTPDYWLRPDQPLSKAAGLHRFVWDLHHERPAVAAFSYPISAILGNTPRTPLGSWALPGTYSVRLTVDGQTKTAPLVVRMDPRVKTPEAGLRQQYTLSRGLDGAIRRAATALQQARAQGDAGQTRTQDLQRQMGGLGQLFGLIEGADVAPTTQAVAAVQEAIAALDRTLAAK